MLETKTDSVHSLASLTSLSSRLYHDDGMRVLGVEIKLHVKVLLHTFSSKRWAIPGLFFFIFAFSIIQLVDKLADEFTPMTGFEPQTSGVGRNRSTN